VRDLNSDGLGDLILDKPSRLGTASCHGVASGYIGGDASVYLSTGSSFVAPKNAGARTLVNAVGFGDFDGDGSVDIAHPGSNGSISFGNSQQSNLLTSIKTPNGGVTHVTYGSSLNTGVGNRTPGIRQLVSELRNTNGRGASRTFSYRYNDDDYDYHLRQPLGFRTVTTTLPKIAGETSAPQLVTNYMNATYGEGARVKSRTLIRDGKTWRKEIFDYARNLDGNGPYVVRKTAARTAEIYSEGQGAERLLETKTTYDWTVFGALRRQTDHGRTTNGADVTTEDDITTVWHYVENRDKYIVNKPRLEIKQTANSINPSRETALSGRFFYYDGASSTMTPATRGNLTHVRDWNGSVNAWSTRTLSSMGYDARGNLIWQRDAAGHQTTHEYSGTENLFLAKTTNAKGYATTFDWDAQCQAVSSETGPNGTRTTTSYDAFCRQHQVSYPDGNFHRTSYNYFGDPARQYIQQTSRSGGVHDGLHLSDEREYFDGFGEVYMRALPGHSTDWSDDEVVLFYYDARGNKIRESVPVSWAEASENTVSLRFMTRYEFDTLGRTLRVYAPGGAQTRFVHSTWPRRYNGQAALIDAAQTVSDSAGCYDGDDASPCIKSVTAFDTRGNTVFEWAYDPAQTAVGTNNKWHTTQYRYDLLSRLTRITDPVGATWIYTYDAFGNRVVADDPGLGRWTLAYDNRNQLVRQVDAKGQQIRFKYDALGRQTQKDVVRADGTLESVTRSVYDEMRAGRYNIGHLTSISRNDHTILYDYWKTGEVWFEKHTIAGRTYALQNAINYGKIRDVRLPFAPGSTSVRWTGPLDYDASGRLISVGSYIRNISYNLRGQPTKYLFQSGVAETLSYDAQRGWLIRTETHRRLNGYIYETFGRPIGSTQYAYYADGRANRMLTRTGWQLDYAYNYSYDYAGRLLFADASDDTYDQRFTYDAAGRMRSNSRGPYTLTYNGSKPVHAPVNVNGSAFTYDANGNTTTGLDNKVMTYDAENRPLSVTLNGSTTRYDYGADGTRLRKIEDAGTANEKVTVYFNAVEIRNFGAGANETILTYPHPNLRLENGQPSFIHTDRLGSTRRITDLSGRTVKRMNYRPYGEELGVHITDPAVAEETIGFIGERYDADAGLQYLNARYYDPKLGLFLQPDWFEVTTPGVGTNRYSYSGNDPINFSDPSGNCFGSGACSEAWDNFRDSLRSFGDHVSDSFSRDSARRQRAADYNLAMRTDAFDGSYHDFIGANDAEEFGARDSGDTYATVSTTGPCRGGSCILTAPPNVLRHPPGPPSAGPGKWWNSTAALPGNRYSPNSTALGTSVRAPSVSKRPPASTSRYVRMADKIVSDKRARSQSASGSLQCPTCSTTMVTKPGQPNSREFDHFIPHSRGGSSRGWNIWSMCRSCNRSKGSKDFWDWILDK